MSLSESKIKKNHLQKQKHLIVSVNEDHIEVLNTDIGTSVIVFHDAIKIAYDEVSKK